jgi:hypothetical protein
LGSRSAALEGLWVLSSIFAGWFAAVGIDRWNTADAHAYWAMWLHPFYSLPPGAHDAYLYSPAFAQVLWPFTHLPWPVFSGLWMAILAAATVWLIAPLRHWAVPVFLACVPAIITGNVYPLFAVVAVKGMRYPAAWAFPLLTKVAPGVGLVWFAARREWRRLGVALAATTGIVVASVIFAPGEWSNWVSFLAHQHRVARASANGISSLPAPSLLVRLPVAVAVVAFAARTNRRWLLPIGMVLADPMSAWFAFLLLTAIPRLRRAEPSVSSSIADGCIEGFEPCLT